MKCNIELYLEQEELACRRIAKTCHDEARQEWLRTAQVLLGRRREHVTVCKKCGGKQ